MPLATGDTGVQLIKNFITSAATINSGTMCFVMGRPLATIIPLSLAGVPSLMDVTNMIPAMDRVFDGACLSFLMQTPVTTAATFQGGVAVAWN